jgi:circadian clock protein KaiC
MDLPRISTGITGLDALLNGGFIKGRSYLLTGDTGTGKTVACLQFLMHGLAAGEKAVYVTADERPAEILASATSFAWDLQTYIQNKSLIILDAASGTATEKGVDAPKMVADLGNYTKSLGATLLIIDPITPLLFSANPAVPRQLHARSLIQLIQSQLATTNLFTSHEPKTGVQDAATGIEQFLASGVLLLKSRESGGRCERVIHVKKMRHTAVEPAEYPFVMVKNQGITLVDRAALGAVPPRHAESPLFRSFEPSN